MISALKFKSTAYSSQPIAAHPPLDDFLRAIETDTPEKKRPA